MCLEVPTSGPIFTCTKGHLVSSTCFQGPTSNCPMCRTRMHRNISLLAKTIIENIEHRCKFETEGCKVKSLVGEVEEHKKMCPFRLVSCPASLCNKEISWNHVIYHITNECNYSYAKDASDQGEVLLSCSNSRRTLNFSATDHECKGSSKASTYIWMNKHFFLSEKRESDLYRKFYVQMLGTKEECDQFTVGISLKDKTGQHMVNFSDNPFSIDMSEEELKSGGMSVSDRIMRTIASAAASHPETKSYTLVLTFANN